MSAEKTIKVSWGGSVNIEVGDGRIEVRAKDNEGDTVLIYLNGAEAAEIATTLNSAATFAK